MGQSHCMKKDFLSFRHDKGYYLPLWCHHNFAAVVGDQFNRGIVQRKGETNMFSLNFFITPASQQTVTSGS